jgi:parallel beta-helix repeat protein
LNYIGVHIGKSNDNNISFNEILSNDLDGIRIMSNSDDNRIFNNNISKHKNFFSGGVIIYSSNFNIIKNNTFFSNTGGVGLSYSKNNVIISNNFTDNNAGIGVDHNCFNNSILYNFINGSRKEGRRTKSGINLLGYYNQVIGNTITKCDWIAFQIGPRAEFNNISYNNVTDCIGDNIWLDNASNNIISYNNVLNNKWVGISLNLFSDNNHIHNNKIEYNHSNYEQFIWRDFDLGQVGILVGYSSNSNIIEQNELNYTREGITIWNSKDNIIQDNKILNSIRGVHIFSYIFRPTLSLINSSSNIINNNTIKYCNEYGIFINDSSINTIIKGNNLIGNQENAFFNNSYPTFWFGNYWDDWDKRLPRPIYGEIKLERLNDRIIPWVQFDWKPASEPYDIPTPNLT